MKKKVSVKIVFEPLNSALHRLLQEAGGSHTFVTEGNLIRIVGIIADK